MQHLTRREALALIGSIFPLAAIQQSRGAPSTDDKKLLADLVESGVRYFWEAADPKTGLVKDRSPPVQYGVAVSWSDRHKVLGLVQASYTHHPQRLAYGFQIKTFLLYLN